MKMAPCTALRDLRYPTSCRPSRNAQPKARRIDRAPVHMLALGESAQDPLKLPPYPVTPEPPAPPIEAPPSESPVPIREPPEVRSQSSIKSVSRHQDPSLRRPAAWPPAHILVQARNPH